MLPDDRILFGGAALVGEFPYVADIQVKGVHTCTAFIYNSRWVVTAASCINGYNSFTYKLNGHLFNPHFY